MKDCLKHHNKIFLIHNTIIFLIWIAFITIIILSYNEDLPYSSTVFSLFDLFTEHRYLYSGVPYPHELFTM